MRCLATILCTVLLLLVTTLDAKEVSGNQEGVWTAADSPYLLTGSVRVPAGRTLLIEAGVEVRARENVTLDVHGTLEVRGSASAPVRFAAERGSNPGSWQGIVVRDDASAHITHARIQHAGRRVLLHGQWRNMTVASLGTGRLVLRHSELSHGEGAGVLLRGETRAEITDNTFSRLAWPLELVSWDAMPESMSGNRFQGLTHHGVRRHAISQEEGQEAHWRLLDDLPYAIDNTSIQAGAALVIDPGVVIKCEAQTRIIVAGRLHVRGAADRPVTITSITDGLGGNTAGQGEGRPEAGDWRGIVIHHQGEAVLEHLSVRYAGHRSLEVGGWRQAALMVYHEARLRFEGGEISHIDGDGLWLHGSVAPTVTGVHFARLSWPIRIASPTAIPAAVSNSRFTAVNHHGMVLENQTLGEGEVRWRVLDDLPYTISDVTINDTAALIIDAGVVVKADSQARLIVNGRLHAQGDVQRPVVFTALADGMGGDTSGQGQKEQPEPGAWQGIIIQKQGHGLLEHVVVRYAGHRSLQVGGWRHAAIMVHGEARLRYDGGEISHIAGDGLWLHGTVTPIINDLHFAHLNWPIRIDAPKALPESVSGSRFTAVAHQGIYMGSKNYDAGSATVWRHHQSLPYIVERIAVAHGARLDVEAGVTVGFMESGQMLIAGVLDIAGQPTAPVQFTADDHALGRVAEAGAWSGIVFQDRSEGSINAARVLYSGQRHLISGRFYETALITLGSAAPTITHSEIAHGAGAGITVHGQSAPVLGPRLVFADLAGPAVHQLGTAAVVARGNWWNAASGPAHPDNPNGAGLAVEGGAEYRPFLDVRPELWREPEAPPPSTARPSLVLIRALVTYLNTRPSLEGEYRDALRDLRRLLEDRQELD